MTKKSEQTKSRLLDQGIHLITENGYHGTGLKKILDTVNVPKGSFYNYFNSKEDYVAQIIRRYAENLRIQIDAYLETTDHDPLTTLKTIFSMAVDSLEDKGYAGCLAGNLAGEIGGSIPACRLELKRSVDLWKTRLCGLIADAQDQGQIREDIKADLMADMLWDIWQGDLLRIRIDHNPDYLKKIMESFLNAMEAK